MKHDINTSLKKVEAVIKENLNTSMFSDMDDHILDGLCQGKFLRSKLGLMLQESSEEEIPEWFFQAAATVELIHSASLIHDDIIDTGKVRRGDSTWWQKCGTNSAVILGDYLFCMAIELLSKIEKEEKEDIFKLFAYKIREMCEGEFEQGFANKGKKLKYDHCMEINKKKTGALFAVMGHIAGGDDKERCEAFEKVGYTTGIAYQFIDDMIDEFGTEAETGKTLGTDRKNRKPTVAMFYEGDGVQAVEEIRKLFTEAEAELKPWPERQAGYRAYISECMMPIVNKLSAKIEERKTLSSAQ